MNDAYCYTCVTDERIGITNLVLLRRSLVGCATGQRHTDTPKPYLKSII